MFYKKLLTGYDSDLTGLDMESELWRWTNKTWTHKRENIGICTEALRGQVRQFSFLVLRFLSSKKVFLCVEMSEKSFFLLFHTWKKNV